MKPLHLLQKLAEHHGIQTSYLDVTGTQQDASPEVVTAILQALGVAVSNENDVAESLRAAELKRSSPQPVMVAWNGKPQKVPVQFPSHVTRRNVYCHLRLENGERQNWSVWLDSLPDTRLVEHDGRTEVRAKIPLPTLPIGYHELEMETRTGLSKCLIIAAPTTSYSSPELKSSWGAFLPMYAVRTEQSWGAGNFSDWKQLANWVSSQGGKVVGSLPLLAAFLDENKCEPSPYSPASRLFWNEFFVDVTAVPEFGNSAEAKKLVSSSGFQNKLHGFRKARFVDYLPEMKARRQVLEILAREFFARQSDRRTRFEKFIRSRPRVRDYATFRAVGERLKTPWHRWPERLRDGQLQTGDFSEKTSSYHQYVQWLAQQQMDDALSSCRQQNVSFYLDLPLGVNPGGYDVWRERDAFANGVNAGAPPDVFFTKGQDWGFAPLHPVRIREQQYKYVIEMLRFQMRHTGLLRVDHIMGLRRLYWIPKGRPASEGLYVRYPADELYAILCLESHRHKTVIVGENLGTVPPEVNKAMEQHHLRQMYVIQYESRPDGKKALPDPTARVVASLNTHDMPTFVAFWNGDDISDRLKLGLIPRAKLQDERRDRAKLTAAIAAFLKKKGFLKTPRPTAQAALQGCLRYLASSKAEIVLLNLEDLWLETQPQNVPGTCNERPNWRCKAQFSLEAIRHDPKLAQALVEIADLRKA